MQFLHGYSDHMLGSRHSLGENPDVAGSAPKQDPSLAAKQAGEAFAKAFKAAKNGKEVADAFNKLVQSFELSQKTLDTKFGEIIQLMMTNPVDEEAMKVQDLMDSLAVSQEKSPELKKFKEEGEKALMEAMPKPFKDVLMDIQNKIVALKESGKDAEAPKKDEGMSTTAKVAIFGGGALALGGLVYFATRSGKK
jgi:hypothetical protein